MVIAFTTAGYDKHSIWAEQYEYAKKVRDGIIEDDEFVPVSYEAEEEDDWEDPKVWKKANPNLGVSKKFDYMEAECKRAKESPAYLNTFLRLELNMPTEQSVRWMPMDKWDACAFPLDLDDLKGGECFGGLDLASTQDLAALVLAFPMEDDSFSVLPRFWIPEGNIAKRVKRDGVPYDVWVRDGLITATPGNVIDF